MNDKAKMRQVDLLAFGGFLLGMGITLLFFVVGANYFLDYGFRGALLLLIVIYTGVNILAGLVLLIIYTKRLKDELQKN